MKNVEDLYPLTPLQKGMLFHVLMAPESGVYVSQLTCTLPADLDPQLFRQAWETLMRRHGVLRTAFLWEGLDEPLQAVRKTVSVPWQELDWRGLPEDEQERRFADLCHRDRHAPFSLGRAPLLRFSLVHLGRQTGFVWTLLHLLLDGWSLPLVVRDLSLVYAALQEGREPALPPVRPFGEYVVWLKKQDLAKGEAFWREELSGFTAPMPLPFERRIDHPAGPAEPEGLGDHWLTVSRETTAALQSLAARHKLTLQTITLGAWALLLHRYSSSGDVVFGCVVSGRPAALPGVETMVGLFINTLPVRVRVGEAEPLAPWLKHLQERQLARQEFEHCPLPEIQRWSAVPSGTPLFETLYIFENYPIAPDGGGDGGLPIGNLQSLEPTNFPVTLTLLGKDRLTLRLTVDRARLEEAAAPRLLQHLAVLLGGMAAETEARLWELSLLSVAERHQLLQEWSDTAASAPREAACLHELFEAQVRRTPEAVALVAGTLELSYRSLDEAADRLAAHLRHRGAGPEVVVGICLERSAGLVVSVLAILKAGAAYLPLDPQLPRRRLEALLTTAQASLVVTEETLAAALPWSGPVVFLPLSEPAAGEGRGGRPDPGNLAYVLFTSGSTGMPKGVAITHGSAVELVFWARTVWAPDELAGVLFSTALSFDLSVFEIFVPLSWGGTVILVRNVLELPALLASGSADGRVTLVNTVPSALAELVHRGRLGDSARIVNLCGETLSRALADRIYATGTVERVWNLYGPSEDTTYSTLSRVARGSSAAPPIGRPITATQAYVLAAGPEPEPLPVGIAGELYLGGAGLARGYLYRPDLTAERFLPDPFAAEPGARMYRTGDLVRWEAAGELAFFGRLDHQVKVRGFRIELGEIEAVLAGLPGVRDAVVVVRAASDDRRLVAYVTGEATAEELRQALRERLPDPMVPAAFVTLAVLPRTPNGKVDRKALLSQGAAPETQRCDEGYVAPRTPVEEVLAGIWAEVLGRERVGVADSFFGLGGHSLLATRVTSRLRKAFGVELPLRDLFETATLAELATRVEVALRAGAGALAPPLAAAPRQGPQPLSFAQQRLWFIDRLEPGSALYNISVVLRVEGPLRVERLRRVLSEIVRRHEALRTVFAVSEGEGEGEGSEGSPVQVVQPAAPFELPVVDLSGLPESRRETAASALAGEEAGRPFDLTRDLMLRCLLLRLAPPGETADHAVALTLHHIAGDAWSMGILVREVAALYAALAEDTEGRRSPLPELPVQYADFAVWQRSWLQGEVLEREIAYWKQHLAGLPPLLELPTDRPRPAVQSYRGAARPVRLPAGLTGPLEALARREGATLFMVLLAGFQALLARYSGQDDLAVGSPIAGRNRVEIEGLIGFFVNTLVMRGHLTGGPPFRSFRELLGRARETALAAYVHQDVPFEKLVEELAPERSLAHAPLFQVMLVLQNAPTESLEVRDLRLRPVDVLTTTAKFDLTVSLEEHAGELAGSLEYSTSLFDGTTVDRLSGHWERLLAAVVSTPDEPAFALPLTSPEERAQILAEWNDTAVASPVSPSGTWVYELFASQVRRTPEAVAVAFGNEELTYAGLDARAGRLARRLQRLGVGPDVPVGLLAERSLDMIVGVLGILQAGGAYVPLDPAYPLQRLAFMLDDTRTPVLLTQTHLRGLLPVESAQALLLDADDSDPAADRAMIPAGEPSADNLGYVIYTSGSTGRPKGVALSQLALRNLIDWHLATLLGGARTLQFASLSFDVSFLEMFACWGSGGTLMVMPEELRRDMAGLADLLVEQRIEKAILPVVVLQQLAEIFAGREDLPLLREITTTGERLQTNRAIAALLLRLPGCAFHNHYGPSETHVATAFTLSPEPEDWEVYPSIGRPIGNSTAYVLEPGLVAAPIGVPGDLYLGGACLARGYLGRPDLTAERFVPDSLGAEPGARLYRTGDKVRLRTDGNLEYVGRFDDQVKIRGFRIEPGEIEALLLTLPGVDEAVVVVREDRAGDRRLVAYVVGEKIVGETGADGLRGALREKLPDYMVPSALVVLPELPLTPNGKVDRKALPAPEWQGAGERHLAPRTPVEEILAGIWAEVLGRERVGVADSFFDLGGHSLLATQVMSRLHSVFGVEMPLRDLFAAPRLADLAVRVEAALAPGTPQAAPPLVPITPALRQGPQPLSFAQQRLWFIDRIEPGSALYNLPVALRVEGPLRFEELRLTLGEIVRRHEALRTVFSAPEGSPVQVVQPAAPFALPVVDLSALPERVREAPALRLAGEEASRPFDLTWGPLLRGVLLRLAQEDHIVALTLHHIASDGWSMGILVREVAALYAALAEDAADRPSPLPELPVQYADFAVWQRSWLQGEVLEREIAYWKQHLAGLPPLLELPTDRPRPAVQSYRGAARPVRLPAGLTRQLEALARREGGTLFMVLLAGFQALLARTSGQDDLAVGSPIAGRNRVEIEGLIGFFVNTLVLRGDLTGGPSFRELLGRVRETALAAYVHQDVPFEKLVEELAPERSLAHSPLFQVMFALQNAPVESLEIRGLQLRPVSGAAAAVKFDLDFDLHEQDGGLSGMMGYATDLFDGATIDRLIGHFERTLAAALATPELPVAALLFLTGAERHQLLVEWNDTESRSLPGCLHHDVAAQAARTPAAVAVEMGIERWTYRRLIGSARRLARHLRVLGVGPDVVVGLCAERSPALVVGMLAVLEAGGAWLPLDPGDPAERLAFLLEDAGAQVLLIQKYLLERVPAAGLPMLPMVLLDGSWDAGEEMGEALGVEVSPDHLAYVIYTSGSTGQPKGVMVPHRGVCNRLRWAKRVYGLDARDAFLHKAASSVDVSVWECFAPLVAGARLVLAEPGRQGESAYLIRTIREHRVTLVDFVPSMLAVFLDEAEVETCVSLRQVFVGGEALSPELRDRMAARLPIPLDNMYGPTEITIDTTRWVCAPGPSPHRVPIGRPIGNSRLYVVDRELRPLPLGVSGELVVGGEGVTRGYLGRPGLSAERFVPDPLGGRPGDRLYRTGDLARYRADGAIEFLGRLDHQVKIRGARIELGEVEAALRLLPAVHDAVAGVRGASASELLTAWVVTREGSAIPAAADLRAFLRQRLPDSMVPAAFVALAALPLTPGGKVDRKALPTPGRPGSGDLFMAPRTPVEELLAAIWSDVLGVERVGVADSFFDLGGHSLLAARVMSRLHSAFGVEIPLRDLFAAPRLADLAVRVEAALAAGTPQAAPPLVRIAPALRQGPQPLSFAQQRLWFIDRLEPGSALYNMPVALRVEGPLRFEVLRLTLGEIVRRHEALRTVFAVSEGEGWEGSPVQVVQPAAPFELPVVDLSGLPESRRETAASALAGEEAGRPFDLTRDLMLHCLLLRLAPPGEPTDHAVLLTMHHIASDGWSMGILVREVAALYAALAEDTAGRPSPLPELPVQYADFAVWQRSWLQGEVLEREIAYWKQHLASLPPLLELPTDRPRPAVQSYRGAKRPVRLPAGLTAQLEALARREGATLFMVLLAGFQALLSRISGQEDLAVGSPTAGRNRVEIEGLIGFFVNTLVLRGDLSGDGAGGPSFRELLARVRETALAAYVHQDVPFEKLVEELAPERSLAHAPLFQVMLVLQNAPTESLEVRDLRLRPVDVLTTTAKFDLTLSLAEHEGGLVGTLEHATDLYDGTTVGRLLAGFERLLAAAVAAPDQRAEELPLLSAAERHQLLEWGGVRKEIAMGSTLHGRFAEQARRTPEAPVLTCGYVTLTYAELDRRSNQLARWLRRQGAGPESRVGLRLGRSVDLVVGVLGVLKSGAAYVPLDPGTPRERLAFVVEDADIQIVVGEEEIELVKSLPARDLELMGDASTLAYVIYTSGSTGRPKGTLITHANVTRLFDATDGWFGFGERDVWTLFHSYAFDFSVWEIWGALLYGGRLVVVPWEVSRSPEQFLDLLVREKVTVLNQTPSAFAQLAQVDAERGGVQTDLRFVIFGGESLDPASLGPWFARHGDAQPRLVNMYGITETTVHVTYRPLSAEDARGEHRSVIGVPIADLSLAVVDRTLSPTPIGVPGELVVGGAGLARGYLGRPDLTAERYVADPFAPEPGGRLYRTGDLVRYLAGGDLEFLGRTDHQVKIRGFRIEPGEIEAALRDVAGVRAAAVSAMTAREDRSGEGARDRRLVAYVVGDVRPEVLRQSLRERLPEHMVPSAFVMLPALPLTPSGKVDRKALPVPEPQSSEESHVAPRTPVEEVLAGIWAEVLGRERVGADDNFFDLGGHSLLATRVMSRLRGAFGIEMPLRDLFEAPVLADLAVGVEAALRALRSCTAAPAPPLVRVPRQGPLPLSFAQQRLWFIDQLEPGSPLYNIPVALRVEGPLRVAVLRCTLSEIVRRHEALRTVFAAPAGSPGQVVQPAAPFELPVVDLSGLPESRRETAASALAGKEAGRPFDLTRDLMLHCLLLRLAPPGETADHVLALTMHHIASDGWSMGILVREVAALYAAFAAGRPSPLPELPVQYADFAVWQRSWLQGEVLESEIAYWKQHLAGLPPLLELPTDRPRPAVQSYRGATRPVRLPAGLTGQLEALARREGATLFMVLLAGFEVLLARTSGQEDLAVGSPIAGRNRVETEGLIGFFVNTLVMRGHLNGGPSFRELLGRVRETALAAYVHQDVPFEKLVEELAPERSLAHAPLFQVMLVLQNAPTESLEVRDLRLRPVDVPTTTAKFDLTASLEEHAGELAGFLEYSTSLFDGTTVDRLGGHWERLLAAAASTPDEPAFALPLTSPEERAQILAEWNDTAAASPSRTWVYELFASQVRRTPEAVAVVFGDEELTYAELDARAGRLARRLRRLGVGPDVPVGLLAERSFEMIVGVLGILQAGGAYVPLDPAYPVQRLAFMLGDTRTPVLLTQVHLRDLLPVESAQVLLLDGDEDSRVAGSSVCSGGEPVGDNLGYVIYTSGSTGRPKGVALSQLALRNLIDWHLATLLGGARTLQFASLSFDASFHEMFACWGSGGTLVVVPEGLRRDMVGLADLLVEQRIEKSILPVVVLQQLAEIFAGREDLPPLREITTTGERLQTNRAIAALLPRLPGCAFHNHYGPSETHVATAFTLSPELEGWEVYPSIGRPIGNSTAYVLEPGRVAAPIGVPGDLYLGGVCLARGYLGRPNLTAERFVPDSLGVEPGARLYRTGDKVRFRTDGNLEYVGRFDDQVKIRGFRIEPGEIEALLMTLPGVDEAVVVVREDRAGDRRLVAYVVGEARADGLRRSLRESLPDYMVPAAFVVLPELPLTPNGKVDRKALPAPEWQGAEESYVAPRTPVEEILAGIWAEVLGRERVGASDSFFDLGGHSLLATQVMSRLHSAFGVEMPLRDLFETPALADFAARIETALRAGTGSTAPPLVPVPREGPLPLSFAQQRLWFLYRLEPESSAFHLGSAVRLTGALLPGALAASLGEIVRRHEVLRTRYRESADGPVQIVDPAAPLPLPVIDLGGLPEGVRERELHRLADREEARPFDLTRSWPLRARLVRLAQDEHAILFTLHHIAGDGWSMGLLTREVGVLYARSAGEAAGSAPALPEPPVQYGDYAVWQRGWLSGERLETQLDWWRERLRNPLPVLELPQQCERPDTPGFRGAACSVAVPAGLRRALEETGRREGATLFMVLLAGLKALLHTYSGQEDLIVGTNVANRDRSEIEGLIGFFVNNLALRTDLSGDPTFRELVRRVRDVTLGAFAHQEVPFEKVLEAVQPRRQTTFAPLFQVLFVLQSFPALSWPVRGQEASLLGLETRTANFDLTLAMWEAEGGMAGSLIYDTGLFAEAAMLRMAEHFQALLQGVAEDPDQPLSAILLATEADVQQLASDFNEDI